MTLRLDAPGVAHARVGEERHLGEDAPGRPAGGGAGGDVPGLDPVGADDADAAVHLVGAEEVAQPQLWGI